MNKVLVDPAVLEEAAKWLEVHLSSSGSAEAFAAEALRESIAQPAEVECVEIIGYVNPENIERMKHGELCGYMIEAKEDKRRSCAVMTVESHLAAMSALTAERDALSRWKQTAEYWYGQYRLVKHGESPAEYPTEGKLDDWHDSYHNS
jgi:hypothetical protein